MRLDRHQKDLAKKLARMSLSPDGQVDGARAQAVLDSLRGQKPRVLRPLLKAYLHHLRLEDRRARLLYEHSGIIPPGDLESLRAHYSRKYGRNLRLEIKENPALLAGVRISVADDIYEASAEGRLDALAATLT